MKNDLDILDFYTQPGEHTDIQHFSNSIFSIPGDVKSLCLLVHDIMELDFWNNSNGIPIPENRQNETNLRSTYDKFQRLFELNRQIFNQPKSCAYRRLYGNCRDMSLLLCAFLRYRKIPARVRSGFATFFDPIRRFDHWICEYWLDSESRWVMVDLWIDQIFREKERLNPALLSALVNLDFNPLDVHPKYFIPGGNAWQNCREGSQMEDLENKHPDNSENYGTYGNLQGLWFVRDNMLRDLYCLNKKEILPWDCFGFITGQKQPPKEEDFPFLDKIAETLRRMDDSFPQAVNIFREIDSGTR